MILVVGNIKGGVARRPGASNSPLHAPISGKDILLVDGDEQHTAITFTELRTEKLGAPGYTAVSLQGAALRTQVRQLATKYDDIIIDVGGRDTGSLRAAITVADTLLIPVQPRSFDIWAVDQMAELVKEAHEINTDLRALAVLNAADAQGKDNADAGEALKEVEGITLLPLIIGRRKAFPNAASGGQIRRTEHTPKDPKATAELKGFCESSYI